MPYYFECDGCGRAQSVHMTDKADLWLPRNCFGCGEEGCRDCMPDNLCEQCRLAAVEDDDDGA